MLVDISPLRESAAFRRLWAGSTLSSIGSALTWFAVPLQVFQITRSPFAVGLVGLAQMVPTLLIGLLGGSLADAVDRRKLVLVISCCLAAVAAGLTVQAYAGLDQVWLLYLLVVLQYGAHGDQRSGPQTFIRKLLAPGQLPAGLALNRLTFQLMLTAGRPWRASSPPPPTWAWAAAT